MRTVSGTQGNIKTKLPVAALYTSVSWVRFTVKESSDLGREGFLRDDENKVNLGSGVKEKTIQAKMILRICML